MCHPIPSTQLLHVRSVLHDVPHVSELENPRICFLREDCIKSAVKSKGLKLNYPLNSTF